MQNMVARYELDVADFLQRMLILIPLQLQPLLTRTICKASRQAVASKTSMASSCSGLKAGTSPLSQNRLRDRCERVQLLSAYARRPICSHDVIRIPLQDDPALVAVEDSAADIGQLAFAHFTLSIEIPVGRSQSLQNIGTLLLQNVIDVVRRHDVGFSTLFGSMQAQQTDSIAAVYVEVLLRIGTVDSDPVDLSRIVPKILDVSKGMAFPILAHEGADVAANAHV